MGSRSRPPSLRWPNLIGITVTNCWTAGPGANPATVAHRLGRSARPEVFGRLPAIWLESLAGFNAPGYMRPRHERVVGWNGAGPQKALHNVQLVRSSTRHVDRRSHALAARAGCGSELEPVRAVVLAASQ